MELIDQHTKAIMEGCKERARDAGLRFQDESLEYIVTNRDLLELSPKMMIPTLYDYWVHDVEVLREKGKYELYPSNPYETVINTRPAMSFYNDNNPDWLNVMIFYHVLAHIDFFQNNVYFKHTWDYDFAGQALSDKRLIARLRSEKGRWVDYTIEFARGIDNITGFYRELSRSDLPAGDGLSDRVNYYFDIFLQNREKGDQNLYLKEIQRYNQCMADNPENGEKLFFSEVIRLYPEFEALLDKYLDARKPAAADLLAFIIDNSPKLATEENKWMLSVLQVVRNTSLFFQPQIRTKIINEGWSSFWHETLFLNDDRISGHEVDFARVNARVSSLPRVGLNPYALGMRLFQYLEELGNKGKHTMAFRKISDILKRDKYDLETGGGRDFIFDARRQLNDFLFLYHFIDQDFVDKHRLFVAGKRINGQKGVWEYYVKSRNAHQYRQMALDTLYHPPHITINQDKTTPGRLYLNHTFEHKPLVKDFIANTMMGIEFLWGGEVVLETSEPVAADADEEAYSFPLMPIPGIGPLMEDETQEKEIHWERVVYTMKDRTLTRKTK
ncbi:MAG: SpoVR family protein [Thermodesulfobacteriota bacterium]|nr:SpoVR family protein [Thermodesulfobacteriota bacterium]